MYSFGKGKTKKACKHMHETILQELFDELMKLRAASKLNSSCTWKKKKKIQYINNWKQNLIAELHK